jgi:hypothetical protein
MRFNSIRFSIPFDAIHAIACATFFWVLLPTIIDSSIKMKIFTKKKTNKGKERKPALELP